MNSKNSLGSSDESLRFWSITQSATRFKTQQFSAKPQLCSNKQTLWKSLTKVLKRFLKSKQFYFQRQLHKWDQYIISNVQTWGILFLLGTFIWYNSEKFLPSSSRYIWLLTWVISGGTRMRYTVHDLHTHNFKHWTKKMLYVL